MVKGGMYPTTIEEALASLSGENAQSVAGATDWLLTRLPASVPVFLQNIDVLRAVTQTDEGLSIGACCTFSSLLHDSRLPSLLHDAMKDIASPAIRNRGTLGGNIANASPAGDALPALYALDARLVLQSLHGTRAVPIEDFIIGVKETNLQQGELITHVLIPYVPGIMRFEKVGARRAQAISKCSFAGILHMDGERIIDFRAAFGAVGKTVVRSRKLETSFIGICIPEAVDRISSILDAYGALLSPIDDARSTADYRRTVCLNLLEAFLQDNLRLIAKGDTTHV